MRSVVFSSACPTWAMTYGSSAPLANSNEMKVWRSVCGVTRPSGGRSALSRLLLARRSAPEPGCGCCPCPVACRIGSGRPARPGPLLRASSGSRGGFRVAVESCPLRGCRLRSWRRGSGCARARSPVASTSAGIARSPEGQPGQSWRRFRDGRPSGRSVLRLLVAPPHRATS